MPTITELLASYPYSKAKDLLAKALSPKRVTLAERSDVTPELQRVERAKRLPRRTGGFGQSYRILRRNHAARPGSKRARQLDIVLAYTNTEMARMAGAEAVDIKFALETGLIKLES